MAAPMTKRITKAPKAVKLSELIPFVSLSSIYITSSPRRSIGYTHLGEGGHFAQSWGELIPFGASSAMRMPRTRLDTAYAFTAAAALLLITLNLALVRWRLFLGWRRVLLLVLVSRVGRLGHGCLHGLRAEKAGQQRDRSSRCPIVQAPRIVISKTLIRETAYRRPPPVLRVVSRALCDHRPRGGPRQGPWIAANANIASPHREVLSPV